MCARQLNRVVTGRLREKFSGLMLSDAGYREKRVFRWVLAKLGLRLDTYRGLGSPTSVPKKKNSGGEANPIFLAPFDKKTDAL